MSEMAPHIFLAKLNKHVTETLTQVVAAVLTENHSVIKWLRLCFFFAFFSPLLFFLKVRCSCLFSRYSEHTSCFQSQQHISNSFLPIERKLTWNLTCPSSPVCPSFSSLSLQAVKTGSIFQLQYCPLGSLLAPHFCLLLVAPYVSTSCHLSEILIYSSRHISAVQLLTGVLQTDAGCTHTTK